MSLEHMELELPHPSAETAQKRSYRLEGDGMNHLRRVLGSGRFSGLKTLRIRTSYAKPGNPVIGIGGKCKALEFGRFTKLIALSLPACDVSVILGALNAGNISQMRSFSIMSTGYQNPRPMSIMRNLSQNFGALLKSGCFKSLQHLDLSKLVLHRIWEGVLTDVDSWKVFIRAVKSGKVPNLTSLGLCGNEGVELADLVPFILSNHI